jgi:hypothetical protein
MPHAKEPPGPVPDLTVEAFWRIVGRAPEALRPAYVLLAATGSRDGEWAMPGKPRGAGRNRTVGWRFCRPLPYHLATAPESGKADQPVGVLQEPRYYSCFFSFNTIATCPSVGPYRLAVSFWLRKRIS